MGIDKKPIVEVVMDLTVRRNLFNKTAAEKASNIYFISGFSTTVDVSEKAKAFAKHIRAKYNEPSTFSASKHDSVYLVIMLQRC